ncbi:MAG: hypothetical protein HYX78_10200 [Armatimonadetes bacterium]|nr:hypothetical protein [Armatimonadota bacterium]
MAEEILVKEPLTEKMVRAGEQLTRHLDEFGFGVTASFWLYTSDWNEWRLVIASPRVEAEGPRAAYAAIDEVLSREPEDIKAELGLHNITAIDPSSRLVKAFQSAVRTGGGISGIRFSRSRADDMYIEDAYVYRAA